jgi:hypothetical protein
MSAPNVKVSAADALLTAMAMGESLRVLVAQLEELDEGDRFPHQQAMEACIDKLLAAVIPAHAEAAAEEAPTDAHEPAADGLTAEEVKERQRVAYRGSAEMDAQLGMLRREMDRGDEYDFSLLLRTGLRRLDALNSVILSILGNDDLRATAEMMAVVDGEEAA